MNLEITKRTDPNLLKSMEIHYSNPKGFVGRNICYAIYHKGIYYGHTVAGSATRFLQGRNEFFGFGLEKLNNLVNNIFFHIEPVAGYPYRNFSQSVVAAWRERVTQDWKLKYGDPVLGFETLVEPPRSGEVYRRDGWTQVGQTKGFTCKRVQGIGSDSWSGKRVWNTDPSQLRPKLVFCRSAE